MKDSLWEVDRVQGVGFRDPRDEQAETLFAINEPMLGPLTRLLEQKLRDSGRTRIEDLRQFALFETVYRPQHVIRALQPLANQGALVIEGNGKWRRSAFVSPAPAPTR